MYTCQAVIKLQLFTVLQTQHTSL